ncbi:sensor histidine kinase [Kitasatospora sp. HPMI-4]|uniref:sensor histidine kinase n=1 Tax=Kitasatospora sp. HPMI-4 TaxID=3448443 RepID=UPI003F1BF4A6
MERVTRAQAWIIGLGRRWQDGRLGRINPYTVDIGLTVFSVLVSVWAVFFDDKGWSWWIYLLAASTSFSLPWRRNFPCAVYLLTGLPSLVLSYVAHSAQPQVSISSVLALYSLADRGRDWQRWPLLVVTVIANIIGTHSPNGMLFSLIMSVGSFTFGALVRDWRALARAETERAHQLGLRAAAEAARAVAEERARIAREMHDILAHAVSLMVIQAEAGPLVVRSDPERAIRAFDTIADSGRDAMVQLRRVLGVLKEEGASPELAPQPTLAELPGVVERVRQAGIRVELELAEPGRPVPADVEAAAYRIVQEALTNVVKHSGADRVVVRVVQAGQTLEIAVCDDGRGTAGGAFGGGAPGGRVPNGGKADGGNADGRVANGTAVDGWSGGRGLVGIRERAAACGGRASAGPGPEGRGFLVSAQLPLGAAVL